MADISMQGLTKVYPNDVIAIRDVHLDVADGEFLVLVGPSGCGKSTLLRMLAGLEEVSAGELFVGGKNVTDAQPRERDMAMVFQSYALYPHMTVRKNISYPLKLARVPAAEIDARVNAAARTLQLEAVLDRKPGQLSGGQRQRVAMGRAIVRKPAVFLMDEPLSNLDAKLRVQMRAEIARLQHEFDTTTVYVTHDQVEAMTMGDRVAVLNAGRIEQCDTPRRLYDRPDNLFVAAFIGSPSMNLFTATVRQREGGFAVEAGGITIPLESASWTAALGDWVGREFTVGLRPEAITERAAAGLSTCNVSARVDFIEELGSEMIVHTTASRLSASAEIASAVLAASDDREVASTTASNLVTKLPANARVRAGDTIDLTIDASQVHLFDPEGPSLRRSTTS
jgi:multiple sugar transport system ATP-binding protein